MLLDVNTDNWTECVNIEVDGNGNVLHSWNLADIITAEMTAAGEIASDFVRPAPNDWFHNNAATYRPSDDSIIVSAREDFVMGIDYSTGAIKWILGDTTKKWHTYPSLAKYTLQTPGATVPPIGQHAVSVYRDRLLLFDDGAPSNFSGNVPKGGSRTYSVLRKYLIDLPNKTATEIWNYNPTPQLDAMFCSSVYEDGSECYLADYATTNPCTVLGLDPSGAKVFDYRYPNNGCGTSWNAQPIHFENLRF